MKIVKTSEHRIQVVNISDGKIGSPLKVRRPTSNQGYFDNKLYYKVNILFLLEYEYVNCILNVYDKYNLIRLTPSILTNYIKICLQQTYAPKP